MRKWVTLLLIGFMLVGEAPVLAVLPAARFVDVREMDLERKIEIAANLGIMIGTGADEQGQPVFAPGETVSHAQLAMVLQRTFQFDYGDLVFIKQPQASDYYRDVSNDAWYADALVMCAINGIFPSGGVFSADDPATRLDIAQAVYRSFQAKGIGVPMIMIMPVFADTGLLTQEEMNTVVFVHNTGIMSSKAGYFQPAGQMERSELASLVGRCIDLTALGASDSGNAIQKTAGQTFVIALDSNPSTGYGWSLRETVDQAVVAPTVDFYYSQADPEQLLVGQGGKHYWQFKALQAGATQLQLVYARPWESVSPLKIFTLPVTVR